MPNVHLTNKSNRTIVNDAENPAVNNIVDVLTAFGISLSVSLPLKETFTETATEGLIKSLCSISIDNNNQLENDSRKLNAGDIFCATIGHQQDGRDFIQAAISQKASLVLAECENAQTHGQYRIENNTLVVEFFDLNAQLFALAKKYYNAPQEKLTVVGVTGTNGKTTISQIIAQLHLHTNNGAAARKCAVIGTTGAGLLNNLQPVINTTPGAIELHQLFHRFLQQGVTDVAMEVSSHALVQQRVHATLFDTAIFCNLSHDHLDYHHTMENYASAKFSIFTHKPSQVAVINGDDSYAKSWLSARSADELNNVIVYGRGAHHENYRQFVVANNIKHAHAGLTFTLNTHMGEIDCQTTLMGDFNVDNLLAASAVLLSQGIALTDIARAITHVSAVSGRMESFSNSSKLPATQLPTAIVDYAHTPDALKNALVASRKHTENALWVVFGCGGERDSEKRPLMGEIAESLADHVIITNDNPRSEAPESIAQAIVSGCKNQSKIKILLDREAAIKYALTQAESVDTVLLSGKGHEQNIVLANTVIAYNEREFVHNIYQNEARK